MGYDLTPAQTRLVQQTIAKDCNAPEFDLFMAAAKSYGLDPFRKQIMPLVFNKDKPNKRQMAIIVSRDGLRVMAQRCGDYRPASEPAAFEADPSLACDTNPKGLISATVRLWKQDNRGEWYPVSGVAHWEEFAPLREIWAPDPQSSERRPTGKFELDRSGNWHKMPTLMLAKCAEAQALRAGWPDQFGGLYAEEEMDRARADQTASEVVEAEERRAREERIHAGKSILTTFSGGVLERVPTGEFCDRVLEHVRALSPEEAHAWSVQNREPLKEFWAASPSDALALKREIERKTAVLGSAA